MAVVAKSRPTAKVVFKKCMGISVHNNARPTQSLVLIDAAPTRLHQQGCAKPTL
jgi:hypothetical protein